MSTTVYDFYKVNEEFIEVDKKIKLLRKDIESKMKNEVYNNLSKLIVNLIDNKNEKYKEIYNIEEGISVHDVLRDEIDKYYYHKNHADKMRFEFFDQSLVVCVFEEEIYIKLFMNRGYSKLFLNIFDKTEDYSYDDRADCDEYDENELEKRKVVVEGVFGDNPMGEAGMTVGFSPSNFKVTYHWFSQARKEIISKIPSKLKRAEDILKVEMYDKMLEDGKERFNISEYFEENKEEMDKKILEFSKKSKDIDESIFSFEFL